MYREAAREVAEAELRAAAGRDIGDWFRFEVGGARSVADAAAGVRLPVTAYIGATPWASFHVDIVGADVRMTGEPEDVPALARVAMPQVEQHGYRVYPLVDHIADKVAATFDRYGETAAPSTRYKDLVDLVAIILEASVDAEAQMAALRSEAERRVSPCRAVSMCPTASSGNAATPRKRDGRCCPLPGPSTRHSRSCGPSSIRCSTGRRSADGIRKPAGGWADLPTRRCAERVLFVAWSY